MDIHDIRNAQVDEKRFELITVETCDMLKISIELFQNYWHQRTVFFKTAIRCSIGTEPAKFRITH